MSNNSVAEKKGLTPQEIRVELFKRGLTAADLARSRGISRQAVNMVINGQRGSAGLREHIATVIDLKVSDVWPE